MARLVLFIAVASALLLTASTVGLIYINRSPKIYSPVLSVALGGVAAAFITLSVLLKAESLGERFPISIVIDTNTGLPAQQNINDPYSFQLTLISAATVEEKDQPHVFGRRAPPNFATRQEKLDFYTELLQYLLIKRSYIILAREGLVLSVSTGQGPAIARTTLMQRVRPEASTKFPGKELVKMLKQTGNRFLNRSEEDFWNDSQVEVPLPVGARISIPDKKSFAFETPGYFYLKISIEPAGGGVGIPPHLIGVVQGDNLETVSFIVNFTAEFSKYTSESPYTQDCKKWAHDFFSNLEIEVSDPKSPGIK